MSPTAVTPGLPASPPLEPDVRTSPDKAIISGDGAGADLAKSVNKKKKDDTKNSEHNVTTGVLSASPVKRQRMGSEGVKTMPAKYEDGNAKDLGVLIAGMLMELIRQNDSIPLRDGQLTRFHSRYSPSRSKFQVFK